jgi:hypothetical protein
MEQHSLLLSDLSQQIGEVKLVLMEEVKVSRKFGISSVDD